MTLYTGNNDIIIIRQFLELFFGMCAFDFWFQIKCGVIFNRYRTDPFLITLVQTFHNNL